MITLSKIKVSDRVSTWINCVNNIIDLLKLATAPSEDGSITGNDGFLSKEDKKKIDDLEKNFSPLSGSSGVSKTWKLAEKKDVDSFFLTVESPDASLVETHGTCEVDVITANEIEYSEKTVLFVATSKTSLTLLGETFTLSLNETLLVKVFFIGGKVFLQKINR